MEKRTKNGWLKKKEITSKWWARQPVERHLLYAAKARAKRKGLEFDIEISDISVPTTCPVLGIPLYKTGGKQTYNSASIDRKDNSKGYIKGNVGVISLKANALKNDMTLDQIRSLHAYVFGRI